VDNSKKFTHISLCAGYGGIDIGLKRAVRNIRTIAFSEIEAYACANLVTKIEAGLLDVAPIWSNLQTFPWKSFRGKVDFLSGGFPCQPFSVAGNRKASEDKRHLWPYIVEGIKQLGKPSVVFFENVEGIISAKLKSNDWNDRKGTSVLLHVIRELERMDYRTTAGIFSAEECGAPHQRKRIFILGIKMVDAKHFRFITDEITKSIKKASDDNKKRTKQAGEFKRTSKSYRYRYIQNIERFFTRQFQTAYPFRIGKQYKFEAPRTTFKLVNSDKRKSSQSLLSNESNNKKIKGWKTRRYSNASIKNKLFYLSRYKTNVFKSALDRATYGAADRVDNGNLFTSFDNRDDEIRLLGNGVVPDTATKAFLVLFDRLSKGKI